MAFPKSAISDWRNCWRRTHRKHGRERFWEHPLTLGLSRAGSRPATKDRSCERHLFPGIDPLRNADRSLPISRTDRDRNTRSGSSARTTRFAQHRTDGASRSGNHLLEMFAKGLDAAIPDCTPPLWLGDDLDRYLHDVPRPCPARQFNRENISLVPSASLVGDIGAFACCW